MSSVKDRLTKVSRLFLRPSGSHDVPPEQLHDPNKVAGFCRQETVTSLKAKKIVSTLLQVHEHSNVTKETDAPAVSKLVTDKNKFREAVESRLTKLANYRKFNPGQSVRNNRAMKPVCKNYELQSRDRQFAAQERKNSEEHRQEQLHFSDGDEGSRSRRASSDGRAERKKTKPQRSASEETHKENKRGKVSDPEKSPAKKKNRKDSPQREKFSNEKKIESMEKTIARQEDKLKSTLEENAQLLRQLKASERKQEKRRSGSVSESEKKSRAARKKQKKLEKRWKKKKSVKKRSQENTDESSDSETESVVQRKKISETRAKLRGKPIISPEKRMRKEGLEELRMARRKSVERRQSQHDKESSSEDEQPPERITRPVSTAAQQSESSSEDEQPKATSPPSQQVESSSESEESEVEVMSETNDASAAEESVDNLILSPKSPVESKPTIVNIVATQHKSRIPILIDDKQYDALANQMMKIVGGGSPSQNGGGEAAASVRDAVAPAALTLVKKNPEVEEIQLIDLDDEPEILENAQQVEPETVNRPPEVVTEAENNPQEDAKIERRAKRLAVLDSMDPTAKLDLLVKEFDQYLELENVRSNIIIRKFRPNILILDETLSFGNTIAAYKRKMLLAHLVDNVNSNHE